MRVCEKARSARAEPDTPRVGAVDAVDAAGLVDAVDAVDVVGSVRVAWVTLKGALCVWSALSGLEVTLLSHRVN